MKGKNGLHIAEPSKYRAVDGTIKKYTWVDDSIYKHEIKQLPPWLFDIIISSSSVQVSTPMRQMKVKQSSTTVGEYQKLHLDMFKDLDNKPTQEDIDYFNCFCFERMDNSSSWINVGVLCFSLSDANGYHIWNALSTMSKKFQQHVINDKWNNYIMKRHQEIHQGVVDQIR